MVVNVCALAVAVAAYAAKLGETNATVFRKANASMFRSYVTVFSNSASEGGAVSCRLLPSQSNAPQQG